MPDTIAPPEPKLSFTQQMAAAAKTGAPSPAAQPAAAAPPAPPETKPATPTPTPPPDKPAPAAAPAATAVDPDDEILSGKRSPKSDDFRRVKEGRDAAHKTAAELKAKFEPVEKELVELRKAPKHNAELIKKLETERDDFKGRYEAFIVQFTPEHNAKFDNQIAEIENGMKNIVPAPEASKLVELYQLPEGEGKQRAIAEVFENLDARQIARLALAEERIMEVNAKRKAEVLNAKQTLSTISQERQKQSEELKTRLGKLFDETLASVAQGDKAIPVYQKREGDSTWNKGVEERERVARAVFNGEFENEDDKAQAALWAAAAPGILADFKAAVTTKDAELAELRATVEKLQGANPGIGTGSTSTTTRKPGGLVEEMLKVAQ